MQPSVSLYQYLELIFYVTTTTKPSDRHNKALHGTDRGKLQKEENPALNKLL